jgi:hypothetical protein
MLIRLLMFANGLLAIALACFVYTMLPYANDVACDTAVRAGHHCVSLGSTTLLLASLVPIAAIFVVAYCAYRVRQRHPRTSLFMLLFWPVATVSWAIVVGASSVS